MRVGTATLSGQSGQKYHFFVYPMGQSFQSIGAVYAISRRYRNDNGGYRHHIIYVGETSDLAALENHPRRECFTRHYANCICAHLDEDGESRLAKKEDLLRHCVPDCED